MKLQELTDQGYALSAWMIKNDPRGERRVVLKLSKKTSCGVRTYVAHAPFTGAEHVKDVEFTAPVSVK